LRFHHLTQTEHNDRFSVDRTAAVAQNQPTYRQSLTSDGLLERIERIAYTLSLTVAWVTAGCGSTANSAPEPEVAVGATRSNITGSCAIQAIDGHYLSAVEGGGRVENPVRSDAIRVGAWERFSFVEMHDGSPISHYALQTSDGHYLTIVDEAVALQMYCMRIRARHSGGRRWL
jgi:hypothetical protein